MSTTTPTITAEPREKLGSRYTRRLRTEGRIPAAIYGHGDPTHVSFDGPELLTILRSESHIIKVGKENCLVKDMQFDHLGRHIIHIDLERVNMNEEITVEVELTLIGSPEAFKENSNLMLIQNLDHVKVACKAKDIPGHLELNVANMKSEDSLTVADIELPKGVSIVEDAETPVATIQLSSAAVSAAAAEAEKAAEDEAEEAAE